MTGLIQTEAGLSEVIDAIASSQVVGLDTEFVRVSTFHPRPGLIQVAAGNAAFLIDPIADLDLEPLGNVLSHHTVSVLHAAQEDYEVLYRLTGRIVAPVFDTQIAHALLAPEMSLSLSALCEAKLGLEISKDETRSDWTQRPLTEAQCRYAREDVKVLEPLYELLYAELASQGRLEWMAEEMHRVQTRNQRILDSGDIETQVHRFGNAWRLSPEGMSRLVHLVEWREATARRVDKPRKHVLGDQSVFQLAASGRVEREHQLVQAFGLTHQQAERFGCEIRNVLDEASQDTAMDPPPPPLSKKLKDRLKERQQACEDIAHTLGIAPEFLVRKRELVASLDGRGWTPDGWRAEVLDGVF
jgi:ribonuclease D